MTSTHKRSIQWWFLAIFLCVGFLLNQKTISQSVIPRMRDLLFPVLNLLHSSLPATGHSLEKQHHPEQAGSENDFVSNTNAAANVSKLTREELELRIRQLAWHSAKLEEQLKLQHPIRETGIAEVPSLVSSELVSAHIIGKERSLLKEKKLLIDLGNQDQIQSEDEVLLASEPVLIDAGDDHQLQKGFPVLAGRTVLGKIAKAGEYTSLVELVTERSYRSRVQIIRLIGKRVVFGSEGILQGDGKGKCVLKYIPATEALQPGDLVMSPVQGASTIPALYYGRVAKINLPENATYWEVIVEPAFQKRHFSTVHVIQTTLNEDRLRSN